MCVLVDDFVYTSMTLMAMRPVIDSVFGLNEARAAFKHLSTDTRTGKVVTQVN